MDALAELTDTISVAADAISTNFELQHLPPRVVGLGRRRRHARQCEPLYARRDLQGQLHRSIPLSHVAVPSPPADDHRRRQRSAAALEIAGRPALTRILTATQALHRLL